MRTEPAVLTDAEAVALYEQWIDPGYRETDCDRHVLADEVRAILSAPTLDAAVGKIRDWGAPVWAAARLRGEEPRNPHEPDVKMRQAIEGRLTEYRNKLHEAERDAYCDDSYRTRLQGAIAELEWVLSLLDAEEKAE